MKYSEGTRRLADFRKQIAAARGEMRKIAAEIEPEEVRDYAFRTPDGQRRLSELFAGKRSLRRPSPSRARRRRGLP